MPASRFLYFAGDRLSIAELSAASLDGHLVGLGEGFMPADAVETPAMRAASLRSLLGDTKAASLLSAAWIWGAQDHPPVRHSAHRAVPHRLKHVLDRRFVLHDSYLAAERRVLLGGVWVSTPTHTLLALARATVAATVAAAGAAPTDPAQARGDNDPAEGPAYLAAARALIEMGIADPLDAAAWLDTRPRMPGKQATRELLCALQAHTALAHDAD